MMEAQAHMMRMLVATDGSQHALKAAEWAARLARELRGAEIMVVHVGHIPAIVFAGATADSTVDLRSLEEEMQQAGRAILGQTVKALAGLDERATHHYRQGDPAAEILSAAQELKADMIIMGSRGRGQIGGLILGSVSERVLHGAHTPVLIVR